MRRVLLLACLVAVAAGSVLSASKPALKVTSSAFRHGAAIPSKHTGDGDDFSPPLAWTGVPKGAKTIAIIVDDPDAPGGAWVHWVLYNLPATTKGLPEHVPVLRTLPSGARQGVNDFGKIGYNGPQPPSGTHRYYFRVYALNATLSLAPGATRAQLDKAMRGHIAARGELMGRYSAKSECTRRAIGSRG